VNLSLHVEKFLLWASAEPEIIAVALVGSHARGTAIDKSDIDLIILASSYIPYAKDHAWLSLFGDVEWSRNEQWGRVDTVRAVYKTGVEIEFNFASPSWAEVPVDPGTRRVVESGFKTLLDPQHLFDALQRIDEQAPARLSGNQHRC
jgi:predicted nucleotidyltransferase